MTSVAELLVGLRSVLTRIANTEPHATTCTATDKTVLAFLLTRVSTKPRVNYAPQLYRDIC